MKNVFTFLVLLLSLNLFAQDRSEHREKIRALKTAYITEGLKLTPKEAQQFWPIYNEYDDKRRNLYRRERAKLENIECMTEDKANSQLEEYVEIEREDYLLKKRYFQDLRKIFTARRIMQLKKVEDEFNEKMMREYKARQASNK
ncbi:hypothetical protein [Salinimicrobium oceani]|uniref:Sensor of ECF-type sigma factor n=1 Tax=Salinimicrobium oceani TaxID=2722702 RepID=A0ABX1D1Q0_9FLAO|nr:hypothetical protein [Salinimicrobium oceani]NJW52786.1 hypothetical protein [Salinimicrobium oceani]